MRVRRHRSRNWKLRPIVDMVREMHPCRQSDRIIETGGTAANTEEKSMKRVELPTALTIIKRIALADGTLKNGEYYLTKYQMIGLCKQWLKLTKPTPVQDDGVVPDGL
jgi:hypothetical protein